jgi:hypothetical protein
MHLFVLLYRSLVPSLLALTLLAPVVGRYAPAAAAADLVLGATLGIVAAPVQVSSSQAGPFADAVSGQLVGAGDVVRTGPGGVALLTFFDGSESQLAPDSQLQVQRADYDPAPRIVLFQSAGVTINRVIPLPPGGSFETDTPTAIGLVRGTSYLVNVSAPVAGASAADAPASDDEVASTVTASDDQVPGGSLPAAKPDVLSSIVLLTDRDGHVGHVQFSAAVEASATATTRLELLQAGDVGTTSGRTAAASHLVPADLWSLERAAADLHDVGLARGAASNMRRVAASTAALANPPTSDAPVAKPDAPRPSASPTPSPTTTTVKTTTVLVPPPVQRATTSGTGKSAR